MIYNPYAWAAMKKKIEAAELNRSYEARFKGPFALDTSVKVYPQL